MECMPRPVHLLIVEDDRDTAVSTALLLRFYGYHVAIAGDGPTALQLAEHQLPDVVLLDLGLPQMIGWQVAKTLHERFADKRPLIIAISGYDDAAARLRSHQVGIDLHFVKPVDFNGLLPLFLSQPVRTMPSAPA
jgi:DNA-binding response OmpR family regulator